MSTTVFASTHTAISDRQSPATGLGQRFSLSLQVAGATAAVSTGLLRACALDQAPELAAAPMFWISSAMFVGVFMALAGFGRALGR